MKLNSELTELSPALAFDAGVSVIEPDIVLDSPRRARRHARVSRTNDLVELTKLRLNFLVMVTTIVGYSMAGPDWSDWRLLIHTLLGTALTAAAASILNQYVERSYDTLMPRTQHRPLPAGRIGALEALGMGVVFGILGLLELFYFVNQTTAAFGAATLGIYIFVYTPLKRVTTLNTVVGAIPGALPPVMGVAAAAGSHVVAGPAWLGIPPIGWALFGILFFWQMPHFLAIAILYRDDYAKGGFKMLPVLDKDLTATSRQMLFYTLALIPVTLVPTLLGVTGISYFFAAIAMGVSFLGFAILCVVKRRRIDARQVFFVSILYLPLLLAAMLIDKL